MANVTFEVIARKCALWCTPCRIEFLRAPGRQLGLSRGRVEPQKVCGRIIRTWRAASAVDWMYQIVEFAFGTGFGVVEDGVARVGEVAVDGAEVDVLDVDLVEDRGDDVGDVVDNTTSAVIAVGPLAAAGLAGGDAGLPCHGSRFDVCGRLLNGPANQGLEPMELSPEAAVSS